MLKVQTLVSVSNNLFKSFKVLKQSENVSKRISCLNRILWQLNSGCLVAGCCFSRQSDEESLLLGSKNNYESSKNKKTDNLSSHSPTPQHASHSKNMKRSIDVPEDAFACVSPVSNSHNKRTKTDNIQNNFFEGKQLVIASVSSTIECEGSEKRDQGKADKEVDGKQHELERPKKYRPNYFVAIKISDLQIHQSLNELQEHILEQDKNLKRSMIQLATLHITLMVMHIGDTETHARAVKALENIHQEHNEDFSKNPLILEFKGLGHFQNRVLFAKLLSDDAHKRLSELADSVKRHFGIFSISSTDSKPNFTPHLTVAKIREGKYFKKQVKFPRKINPSLYRDFNDQYFGSQQVQGIQLLSMTDPKDEVGYYSGNEIYFSAFEPKIRNDSLSKMLLETQEKKKNVKEKINTLMREKLK